MHDIQSDQQGGDQSSGGVYPVARESAVPPLLQYWNIVYRHRLLIAAIVGVSLVIGLIITLLSTPQYEATSRIEIARQQANVTNVESVQSEEAGRDLEFYFTQYSLLEARSLAERVVRRLNLARNDAFFESLGVDPDEGILGVGQQSRIITSGALAVRQRLAADALLENITVSPIRGSALVDVSFSSASPNESARIANAWVEEFIQQSMDRRFASTADARRFLQTRLEELRQRVEVSERELVNYAADQGIVRIETGSAGGAGAAPSSQTLTTTDLVALSAELSKATADRVIAEGRLDAARARGASSESLQNPAINGIRERRAEIAAEYAKLLVQFEPEYPAARALREQMTNLDASIVREERRVVDAFTTAFGAAKQREDQLRSRVNSQLAKLDKEERDSIQYKIFQREADTNRQLYDGLLQRFKEIGVAGIGANNISIVDAAIVPTKPSSPRMSINLLIALALGVGLAVVMALIMENLDEGIREPDDIQRKLNVATLGVIPQIEDRDVDPRELVKDPKTALYEAYQSVRTNLAFSTDHGVPRSLMITSTAPSEGKSTSSFAIGLMLSRNGAKVAIVDVDLRKPVMHKYMDLKNQAGVSDYLAGASNLAELIQATAFPNIAFLSAGPIPPSAAELLSGTRLGQMVQELLTRYDHVVLDSPPMLGLADAPLIANKVEGIVYIVEAKRMPARGIAIAMARLRDARTRIFGVVLTKYRSDQYGYGYGYGYGYQYGKEDADIASDIKS